MTAWGRGAALATGLAGAVSACAPVGDPASDSARGGLLLQFEDSAQPAAFSREGLARSVGADGAEGLWAVVAGLPRPERAMLTNLETGAEVEVALFRARRGTPAADIQVSEAAAEALGIGGTPVPVRVVALRREARLATSERF